MKTVFTVGREDHALNIAAPQGPTLPDITMAMNGVQKSYWDSQIYQRQQV